MTPISRLAACLALSAALCGCDTSSNDVMLELPGAESSPESLSVAWHQMQLRVAALEGDLSQTRGEVRNLCADSSTAAHPACARIAAAEQRAEELASNVQAVEGSVYDIDDRVRGAERTLAPLKYDARKKAVYFTGVDVHVRNGTGATDQTDGTGNLIIGWNEADDNDTRSGSHNLVVGSHHAWEGHSGLAAGMDHALLANAVAAVGGEANTAAGNGVALVGGQDNTSSGFGSVVVGGAENRSLGEFTVTAGGFENDAIGAFSMTVGGSELRAEEEGQLRLSSPVSPGFEGR